MRILVVNAGSSSLKLSLLDDDGADGDTDITAPGAAVRAFVLAAREDLEIARQVREVLER